ncbi:hypothetical protein F7725_008291 [Dissostichus mawsoni]|uniref:Uncharacterized protein n=1 Tax=Dissostichus mawsoni TaxID=36200 RepID=A0A7J5Y9U3_DISMA|nr:hypothetical protein F7725_008291 [Dissostichus mawsoni]
MNYSYLLPYVSHWRNLQLYCMTKAEYEDEEAAEEFKISSFVTMVQDCYRHIQNFDMFMLEKWPLIQAFALEGIGGGSFFTMKYKIMDMSEKLWQVYNRLDPVSIDHLLIEDLVNFEKQWSGFFSSMDLESHLSILELSEAQAGEMYSAAVQAVLSGIKCFSCTSSTSKACMTVQDIPDLQWGGGPGLDGTVSSDSCYTVLTTTVPRYACWLMESDVKQSEEAQHLAKGLLFIHSQYGSITLSKDHISTIKFYDPDSSAVASLLVEYKSSLLPHLPFPLHSADRCLVFALQPRSKSHRAFYSKVLCCGKTLNLNSLCKWHSRLQKLHDSQEPPVAKRRGSLKTSYSQLPEQDMFLQHFALSSIGQEPILYDHLGVLFPSAELRNPVSSLGDKVVVTIITGLPGSHKERLCNYLVQLNKERGRWVVYKPDPDSCDSFSASHLQQYLSGFLESQRGPGGKPRLLVLSPGYTDVLDVVQAVLFHPDPVVQACFTIGAVTACVDPLASCVEHRFTFPKLLEQCSQGIASTVVFTGLTAEQKHPLMKHVQQLVRSANPTAAFILAERGAVTRNEDVNLILSESSFNEPQMLRARYVLYPGWCKGRFFSGSGSLVLTQQRVAFNRPLERPLFVTRSKDSEQLMEVSYNTVSGSLSIVPLTPGPKDTPCFLVFDGVGLTADGLKDWLRLCAKQMTRHLDPLPPGFFYNDMEEFIQEYITEANKEVEQFNRQLELQGMESRVILVGSLVGFLKNRSSSVVTQSTAHLLSCLRATLQQRERLAVEL